MCTMCAQLNNKEPVRFGRETASCDMPTGCVAVVIAELFGMSSGLVGFVSPY